MPVYQCRLQAFSLNYVTARHPFAPCDLVAQAQQDIHRAGEGYFSLPILLDLRSIDLLAYSTEEFKLLLSKRQSLEITDPAPPCAYVVRDEGSYGMMRVFTSFAAARGFRSESLTLITTDLGEAVDWMYPRVHQPAQSQQALQDEIEALTRQIDGTVQEMCTVSS